MVLWRGVGKDVGKNDICVYTCVLFVQKTYYIKRNQYICHIKIFAQHFLTSRMGNVKK